MRIAYVEDNPTNLALVERVVSMGQHKITSYTEGEIAVQALTREKFELILMDIELAGDISGLQVVRNLRSFGLKTPIVAVTAYAMLGDRDKCLEAGCDDYLPKPIPIMDLVQLLARYDTVVTEKRKTDEIKRKTDELKRKSDEMKAAVPSSDGQPQPAPAMPTAPLEAQPKTDETKVPSTPPSIAPASTDAKPMAPLPPQKPGEVKVPEPVAQKTDDAKPLPNTL